MPFSLRRFFLTPRYDFNFLLLVVLLEIAAVVRFPYTFTERMLSDEGLYSWYAQQLHAAPQLLFSKQITFYHPPLFSFLLSLGHFFSPTSLPLRVIMYIFYLLGIVAMYALGTRIKNSFVGIVGAIALAFNFNYFLVSNFILADMPFVIFCMFLGLALLNVYKDNSPRRHLNVALWTTVLILTKWYASIIIGWIALYYWLMNREGIRGFLKQMFKSLWLPAIVLALLCLKDFLQKGYALNSYLPVNHLQDVQWGQRLLNCFVGIENLVLFFSLGLLCLFKEDRKIRFLLFTWFAVFLSGLLSITLPLESRLVLYIIPSMILIACLAIDKLFVILALRIEIGKVEAAKKIFLVCFLIIFFRSFCQFSSFVQMAGRTYSGYKEAAQIIRKDYVPSSSLILAGSERQMRYFTGIKYIEDGGDIMAFRQGKKDFEQLVGSTPKKIILVVDQWESLQPSWIIVPLDEKIYSYLRRLGFGPPKAVWAYTPRQNFSEYQYTPAVWVFERPPTE